MKISWTVTREVIETITVEAENADEANEIASSIAIDESFDLGETAWMRDVKDQRAEIWHE